MLPIFNYNSRSFTILAIIFIACLAYYNISDKSSSEVEVPNSAAGARYVMEIDPNNPDKTWWERAILFVFGREINKKIEHNKQLKELPTGTTTDGYISKVGDKALIVYYSTNPMPPFMPSPEEVIIGKNNLPKDVDKMLIGLRVGDKREFKSGNTNYHIELISIIEPSRESINE